MKVRVKVRVIVRVRVRVRVSSASIAPRRSSSSSERRPAAESRPSSRLGRDDELSSWHAASPSGSKGKKIVRRSICSR